MHEIGRPEHASTEQLSALLDDRAEPGERWFLAEHVDTCERCASELNGLRSVSMVLRALPVHLPPRDFTIPTPMIRPVVRPSRLLAVTRTLGALAAVLCVVFFSADALLLDSTSSKQFQSASDAAMITNATKVNGDDRAARSAAESASSARPADASGGRVEYPPAAVAAPAAPAPAQTKPAAAPPLAQAPKPAEAEAAKPAAAAAAKPATDTKPAAAAKPAGAPAAAIERPAPPPAATAPAAPGAPAAAVAAPTGGAPASVAAASPARAADSAAPAAAAAPVSTLAPLGTITAFQPGGAPPVATMPPRATSAVVAAPPQAPAGTGAAIAPPPAAARADMPVYLYGVEVTPLRVGGVILGVIAAVLFFYSAMISRSALKTSRDTGAGPHSN